MTPVEVVQAQLEAYNRRDIAAFSALFATDAQLFEFGAPTPSTTGRQAIRERYQQLFEQSPALHSVVTTRSHLGRVVVDLEVITGRNASADPVHVMAIYEVSGGLITRAHFVR